MDHIEQHLEMLRASVVSSQMSDTDVAELFELVVQMCRQKRYAETDFVLAMEFFNLHRPAVYADCVRSWFVKHPDDDIDLLLTQAYDPESSDAVIVRTFNHILTRIQRSDRLTLIDFGVVLPLLRAYRDDALRSAITWPGQMSVLYIDIL